MMEKFSRTQLLLGKDAIEKLMNKRIAIFGIGGVGGYTVEALARCGVGNFDLIDNDKVNISNINRQIIATDKTIGKYKVDLMKERIFEINPQAKTKTHKIFFLPENSNEIDFTQYDYVVDAVDTITAKIEIIQKAKESNIPIISCMGAGNKLNPAMFEVADIYKTSICPLAKVMRRELKKRNIDNVKVVFSKEPAIKQGGGDGRIPGSVSFVPSVAGLILASEVVKDLI